MSNNTRVASRYSKSLIEFAMEKGLLEEVNNDMTAFLNVCKQNKEFVLMLKKPIIDHYRKSEILGKIFKGKINDLTFNFLKTVALKNREAILPEIAEEFHKHFLQVKGIITATLTTASPVSNTLLATFTDIIKKTTGKDVELIEKTDPSLIGGYQLRIGDSQIDDSIKTKLKELKMILTS